MSTMNDNTLVTLRLDASMSYPTLAELGAFLDRARIELSLDADTHVVTRRSGLRVTEGDTA